MKALALLALVAPQTDHAMHAMPGMTMPAKPAARPARPKPKPAPARRAKTPAAPSAPPAVSPPDPHAGHAMPGMAMPDMAMPTAAPAAGPAMPSGTDLPPGDSPAPAAPTRRLADAIWGADAMTAADRALRREHGGMRLSQVLVNIAEYQARAGRDGYRWDAEVWTGGDRDRLVVKTEGEGAFGTRIDDAEVQALFSRAIGPYFNVQAGVRHDITPTPSRTYAAIGIDGLAPYWFDVEATVFVSTRGEVLVRGEAWYDQRLTQTLVLQPRIELNLAAQDVPDRGISAGLSDAEIGLRLRYERNRALAPYVGLSWQRRYGRAAAGDTGGWSALVGIRAWY